MKTGRIYKIITQESNECYVGSTFDELRYRFKHHKDDYKKWKDGKKPKTQSYDLFEKYGVDKCKMILIKEYEVIDRLHLEMYETLWIFKLKSINKNIPFGNKIKELRLIKEKQYREDNKEAIKERQKKYRKKNKDKLREYERNRPNKLERLEKNKEKIICECGSNIIKLNLARHRRSNKHIKLMEAKK